MGQKIEVTRLELSASQLRRLASRSQDGRVACRVLAIAHVLEGASRAEAASACGMDRQTLCDWVHRYNHDGIGGLSDAPRSGRPSSLSDEQLQDLKDLVLAGPDLAIDGVTRWRCLDLCAVIAERGLGLTVCPVSNRFCVQDLVTFALTHPSFDRTGIRPRRLSGTTKHPPMLKPESKAARIFKLCLYLLKTGHLRIFYHLAQDNGVAATIFRSLR